MRTAILVIIINLLLIEIIAFAIYKVNPAEKIPFMMYPNAYEGMKIDWPLGWNLYNGNPRPHTNQQDSSCAAVFGDSFAHGDEVEDDEAWAAIASGTLGCEVENYGVNGYGADQAVLKVEQTKSDSPIIYLSIFQSMLRRNLAPSWLFFGLKKEATLKPFFLADTSNPESFTLKPQPTKIDADIARKYHREDVYRKAYEKHYGMRFPYSLHMLSFVYNRLKPKSFHAAIIHPQHMAYTNPQALILQKYLMKRFVKHAHAQGKKAGFIFMPTVNDVEEQKSRADSLQEWTNETFADDVCSIDILPNIIEAHKARPNESLRAPLSHFSAYGNILIADAFVNGHRKCVGE